MSSPETYYKQRTCYVPCTAAHKKEEFSSFDARFEEEEVFEKERIFRQQIHVTAAFIAWPKGYAIN
jgi:hypothetical protein